MEEQRSRGEPDMELIYVAQGHLEAAVIKGKLEEAGIPVLLKYESAGLVFGFTVDGLGQVRVFVPADCADEARRLLAESSDLTDEEPDISDPEI